MASSIFQTLCLWTLSSVSEFCSNLVVHYETHIHMITMMYVTVFSLDPLPSQMDNPSKKISEIKPTGNEDAKVLNGTMDDSSQRKQIAPDCDDVVSLHFVTNMIGFTIQKIFSSYNVPKVTASTTRQVLISDRTLTFSESSSLRS